MNTTQIPASEVRPGMQFLVAVLNRQDPKWGQEVTATVTEVVQAGPFLEVRGQQDELNFQGYRPFKGAAYKPSALVTIVTK